MWASRLLFIGLSAPIAAIALLCAGAALAQLRALPDETERGQIRHVRELIVEINGVQARLSPGAQIRDRYNRIVLPVALPPEGQLVKFLLDPAGMVHRVWILTEEEAARPDNKR